MSTNIDWGEFQGSSTGDWQKFTFTEPGDSLAGLVTEIRIATMPDGTRMPALTIKNDEGEWSVLASQVGLQRALAQHRPSSSDAIAIVMTGFAEAKPGKSPAKLFDVVVKRGDDPAAAAPVAPAPAAPAVSAADLL